MVLATHNFHDQNNYLPPGAANDVQPFGSATTPQWGSSWKVYILPYIEQQALYSQWQFTGNSGYVNATNNALVTPLFTIPIYRCPSTPVPERFNRGGAGGSIMIDSYTGIAGSVMTLTPAVTPIYNVGCCNGAGPLATDNGVFHAGSKVAMVAIKDGTSNTMFIGEQSDHVRDAAGLPVTSGYTAQVGFSGGLYGWIMGAAHPIGGGQNGWGDGRHFNCTSVRWKINQKGLGNSAANGTNNDVGTNFPLSSGHTGGVNVGMGDGSIRFVRDTIDDVALSAMCTKSNGESVSTDQ
jgi:hypothetical protein